MRKSYGIKSHGILKLVLWCTLVIYAGVACMSLSSCGTAKKERGQTEQAQSLYAGKTQEADVFIEIPDLRQYGGYTCGTTCVQMLMNWIDPYNSDLNLATYEEELGTNEEAGTPPENIVEYFEDNEVKISAKEKRTTDDLISALDRGHPVLMCIQAWSSSEEGDGYNTTDPNDADTYLTEGHWVICVGYQDKKGGYAFYFNDPACVGHCMMSEKDLDERWIDMDARGKIYDHYGIEIEEDVEIYDPDGIFYLE